MNSRAKQFASRCGVLFIIAVCVAGLGAEAAVPSITVTSPNGTQAWSVGGAATVSWTSVAVTGRAYILLYYNWTKVRRLATVNVTDGTYCWSIPENEPAGNVYRFRVQSKDDTTVSGYSGTFTINAPKTLAVTAPNGGEVWSAGTTKSIAWTTTGLWGNANVYLYDNWTKLRKIATVPIQNGTMNWVIPANELANNTYRIRVQSALDTSVNDYSDATFTIIDGPASVHLVTPNGAEVLSRGTAQTVAWTSMGLWGNVNILLYNNWTKIGVIGTAPIHAGSWTWNVPSDQTVGSTYRIRVQSLLNTSVNDYSDGLFSVQDFGAGSTETLLLPGKVPLTMTWVPAGSFAMGRYPGELSSAADEDPRHMVQLTGFWIGKYEVTKAQWTAIMGTAPWSDGPCVLDNPNSPAVYISWNDAQSFVVELSLYTGQLFRLPSESQWEYACRANTTTRFYWGDDVLGTQMDWYSWNCGNCSAEGYAHVVGLKLPNAWGLYDMSGNAFEYCQDHPHGNYNGAPTDGTPWEEAEPYEYRVRRGGSWYNVVSSCRSAARGSTGQVSVEPYNGFRLAK